MILNEIKKMTFSIIGSESYLAKHFIYVLNKIGHTLFLYEKLESKDIHPISISNIDITSNESIQQINTNVDFTLIFSGITGTLQGFTDYSSYINVNEIGLLNILNLIKQNNSKTRVVFPSTRLIYKGSENKLKENDAKEFKTIYALTKFNCETYLNMYQTYFGIPYTIFRICVPYGNIFDTNMSYGTLGNFINTASKKEDITIFGNGYQKRSLIHIEDLVNISTIALLNDNSENCIFNVGGNDIFSISEIAQSVADLFGVKVINQDWPFLSEKIESGHTVFDSTKIEQLTNYKYQHTFKEWINNQKSLSK